MKSNPLVLILTILLLPGNNSAQDLNDKVLMTVAGKDVSAGEFIRMFKKSYEPGNTNELDTYLNQFITFKQKVADAIEEGYDTTRAFKTELQGYRNQLAQNYLTDSEAKEKLLKQAYQRSLTEINAWHILINCQAEASPEDTLKAWKKAMNIRERILKGESFEQVARGTSDDPSVKTNGGNRGYFTAFQMIMPFEDAAYSLKKDQISEPVRTPYGYHIIKVADRRPSSGKIKVAHIMKTAPPGTGEKEAKAGEDEINSIYKQLLGGSSFSELASLNSISRKSFIEKLKKEYKFRINTNAFNWFAANTDTMIINGLSKYNRQGMPGGAIYTFANQQLTTRDFASYIEKRGSRIVTDDPAYFISRSIETRLSDHIMMYENSILEKKYPEFRYLMNEFHDGILLFEISGNKVWNKSQDDSTGLRQYYENNKKKFLTRQGIEARIYVLKKKDGMKSLSAAYKKFSRYPDLDRRIVNKFISIGDTLLSVRKGTWFKGDKKEIDNLKWIKGYHEATISGFPCIVVIDNIIEPEPLPFSEVQGEMVSGYQEYLENSWIKQLKEKYPVKIDNAVLEEIRKKLNNE